MKNYTYFNPNFHFGAPSNIVKGGQKFLKVLALEPETISLKFKSSLDTLFSEVGLS